MEQAIKNPTVGKTALAAGAAETEKYHYLSAVAVFVTSLVVYLLTVAPSLAFWDCGEYIAAGHSLGIPHPPGNPLFVLVMRVSSMAFAFFDDPGYRMNLAVVIASALTAAFIYLVVVEAMKMIIGEPDTMQKRITMCVGGIVGGLFAAFGYTFWFSAVETSVYNLSMLSIVICTFLMLRWAQSKRADRDKLLILVAFLGFSGIGLHMYTMIIFPPAFLFMILWDEKKRKDWRLWATGLLMATIVYNLSLFIKVGPAVLVVSLLMSFLSKEKASEWRLCFFFAFFAILGYSVHLFIPIRSALEPMINENHPDNWEALIGFLERTQYGSESMLRRMFWRRGAWATQFGIDAHMGFGGFHITQFFRFGLADREVSLFANGATVGFAKLFLYLIPTALMIFGWSYMYKRNKPAAVFLVSLVLLTTVGMVLYMNFADGTRAERLDFEQWTQAGRPGPMPTVHREVRVRDYFFTAGFMYFGMWIGIAASCLLNALYNAKEESTRKIMAPVCAVLLAVSPVIPAVSNFALSTRAGDWVAYDYAYNMLQSSEPNGIIITNGDNDTFPLWAMQEAYDVRRDVRIVNLSLANTAWYNLQLQKLAPRVPMTFSEAEVAALEPALNRFREPRPHAMRRAGITVMLPSFEERRVIRVADRLLLNVVDAAAWDRPVYFASTVSEDNYLGLGPFLSNEGLLLRVMPERVTGANRVNVERILHLADSVFLLRGIGDAIHNETSRRLLINYLQIAVDLRAPMRFMRHDLESARRQIDALERIAADTASSSERDNFENFEETLTLARANHERVSAEYERHLERVFRFKDRLMEMMHFDWRVRAIYSDFLIDHGRVDDAFALLERALTEDAANREHYERLIEQARMMTGRGQ